MGLPEDEKKLPYPRSVFFIVSNEFCERFSFYGMKAILSLYARNILLYSETDSKIVYHVFTMFAYFFPLFGAILSDSWLGKFKTILYLSVVYASGNVLLALASAEPIGLPQIPFSLVGLFLIAFGTGGIKPCVSAFGGDQFVLPQQEIQLAAFFSMFYFAINAGSLISTFLTPVLRENVHCFGQDTCFPLAFAVPGVLMIISIVIFTMGKPLYKVREPEGNIVVKVVRCIFYGVKQKIKSDTKVDHWLDHSQAKFGKSLVYDVKRTLKVLVLFIPLPIFWALYDQQGSGWIFQAAQMNGDIGFYTILPDQMQVANPLLILIFIPLFTCIIYPTLAKCNLVRTPLQRMVCGGLLTAIAFVISAGVSYCLESTYPVLPTPGTSQLRIYNPLDCNVTINAAPYLNNEQVQLMSYRYIQLQNLKEGDQFLDSTISGCESIANKTVKKFVISEGKSMLYYWTEGNFIMAMDDINKHEGGLPTIRLLANDASQNLTFSLINTDGNTPGLSIPSGNFSLHTLHPGTYKLNGSNVELKLSLGGVYTILTQVNNGLVTKVKLFEITKPNSIHLLWQLPQYIVITAAEIMFSITGLEFSYSQAPRSMKSVLTAAWLLTTAVGNLIIVIIESAKIFDKQSYDFLLYAVLMVLDLFIFAYLAVRYKYCNNEEDNSVSDGADSSTLVIEDKSVDNPNFKNDYGSVQDLRKTS